MSTTPTLLPCPFCGSPGSILDVSERHPMYFVRCSNDECCIDVGLDDTREKAAAIWNRRAALTQGAGAVEPVAWGALYFGAGDDGLLYNHFSTKNQADQYVAQIHRDGGKLRLSVSALHTAQQLQQAVARAIEECAVICEELETHYTDYASTALLNGDVALSNAASGEPRACRAIAAAIRAKGQQ